MSGGFEGAVAFVTGATSGIGRATASAREGAGVVVADVAADGARETARLIEQAGGESLAVGCVALECVVSDEVSHSIDAGYRYKYGRYPSYVEPMISRAGAG